MHQLFTLAFDGDMIPVVAIGGGLTVAIVSLISSSIRKTKSIEAREESRREIAAYVAEGSMTADDAAKLINAGGTLDDRKC